jgi:catechol 2,3-dioxygenase-like lactoylglutathione lyase family enzyme
MTRRELLRSFPALFAAPRLWSQAAKPTIAVTALNQFTLSVSDVKRSIDFYQSLFGMPIQVRQGSTALLRIGNGPQFLAIRPAGSSAPSILPLVGMSVENFNADRLAGILEQHGVTRAAPNDPGLSGGAMKMRIRRRGPESGGAKEGSAELFFGDPDDLVIQLTDNKYCGGLGALGEVCPNVEPPAKKGLMAVREINHFTINTSNGTRSNTFYRDLFGLPVRSQQGAALGLGIGPGKAFVMFAGGGGGRGGAPATPRPASINHVCMNMEKFNPDEVLRMLSSHGITPRENAQGPAGPLKSYVTLRMENRGGAPGGTPELYFTDPDGLLIQLQDVSYCGGAGFLGNVCTG